MRLAGFVLCLAVSLFGARASAADADVLRQFGILGRLAVDCSAPPGNENPNLIFGVSANGQARWTLSMGVSGLDGTFPIRNLRQIAPDLLQYNQPEEQSELTITLRKVNGKLRSWRSESTKGEILIADGKFTSDGRPTLAFTFCGS